MFWHCYGLLDISIIDILGSTPSGIGDISQFWLSLVVFPLDFFLFFNI